jgi:hypothetical protein
MSWLLRGSYRQLVVVIAVLVVLGGAVLGVISWSQGATPALPGFSTNMGAVGGLNSALAGLSSAGSAFTPGGQSYVITQTSTETAMATTTLVNAYPAPPEPAPATPASPQQAATSSNSNRESGSIEYFSNVTMVSSSPPRTTSAIVTVAYAEGGYVAYSSSNANYSFVVVRVPAANFQDALSQIQSLGNVTNTARWSNDVTVQYTDLNATLASLETEQTALLKILNSSSTVNNTLAIESQIQIVNQQIDETESQILQTQRLISYSTISVSITISSKAIKPAPLSLKLSDTPASGISPLGVTFSAIVQGGTSPYVVNYNFGDGTSQQGQVVIHQYYQSGDFNATVTVTDASGNVAMASSMIHVKSPPSTSPLAGFGGTVENLFVSVIEDIAEVAVVVIPIGLVLLVILIPLRRRAHVQKQVKPS